MNKEVSPYNPLRGMNAKTLKRNLSPPKSATKSSVATAVSSMLMSSRTGRSPKKAPSSQKKPEITAVSNVNMTPMTPTENQNNIGASHHLMCNVGNLEIKNIHAKFNASAIVKLRVADESKLLTQKGMKLTNDLACYQIEESAQFFCKNQMCIMEVEVIMSNETLAKGALAIDIEEYYRCPVGNNNGELSRWNTVPLKAEVKSVAGVKLTEVVGSITIAYEAKPEAYWSDSESDGSASSATNTPGSVSSVSSVASSVASMLGNLLPGTPRTPAATVDISTPMSTTSRGNVSPNRTPSRIAVTGATSTFTTSTISTAPKPKAEKIEKTEKSPVPTAAPVPASTSAAQVVKSPKTNKTDGGGGGENVAPLHQNLQQDKEDNLKLKLKEKNSPQKTLMQTQTQTQVNQQTQQPVNVKQPHRVLQALAAGPSTVPPSSINSHISHISPKPVVTQKDTNSTTGSINGSINGSNTNTSTGPINGSIQPGSALAAIGSQGASLKQGLFIFVLVLCAFFSALWVAFAPAHITGSPVLKLKTLAMRVRDNTPISVQLQDGADNSCLAWTRGPRGGHASFSSCNTGNNGGSWWTLKRDQQSERQQLQHANGKCLCSTRGRGYKMTLSACDQCTDSWNLNEESGQLENDHAGCVTRREREMPFFKGIANVQQCSLTQDRIQKVVATSPLAGQGFSEIYHGF